MTYERAILIGGRDHGEEITFKYDCATKYELPTALFKEFDSNGVTIRDVYDFVNTQDDLKLAYYHYSRTDIVEDVPPPSRY